MKKFKNAADIKVGVVGYGGAFNMGKAHLDQMNKAGMTPVAVAEIDPERRKVATKDFPNIKTFANLGTMLKNSDVNLITIITPHNTHAKIALQALKAGCSVVCEKPLAITTNECDSMIAAAKANNALLSTYHNRHWDGHILETLDVIKSGVIGDVFRIDCVMGAYAKPGDWWRSSKSISGGVLYDWGVHLLEYSLQVLGKDAKIAEVSAFSQNGVWASQTAWKDDTFEDDSYSVTRFTNGAALTLNVSNLLADTNPWILNIRGTKGTVLMGFDTIEVLTPMEKVKSQKITPRGGECDKFYQNIADTMTGKEKLIITPEWSRRPIHILDLSNKSAVENRTVKAKYE